MKKSVYFPFLFLTFLLFSCGSNEECTDCEMEVQADTLEKKDDLTVALKDTATEKKSVAVEMKENHAKIVQKYGEQWGFCECVVANDSIDRAVKKITDFETPDAEKLLNRFDYVSKKCQAFLGMDANRTPEERQRHEKKVKRCLREAKNG